MKEIFEKLYRGENLSQAETTRVFTAVFSGELDQIKLSSFLTALKIKGETPEEITGAATAMVAAAKPFPHPPYEVGEIVGTGGDSQRSINISTMSALAAASLGLKIVKHGNRSVSSKTGAADILAQLGIQTRAEPDEGRKSLEETNFCFCMATVYHPGMRFAGPVRASLGTRTIFNILGPLTNPSHPDYALIGVYSPDLIIPVANTLKLLGVKRAFTVHGCGFDEIVVHGPTDYAELKEDGSITSGRFTPADFGFTDEFSPDEIRGGEPEENAKIATAILSGNGTPAQAATVAANLAVLLYLGRRVASIGEGVALARETLASGAAMKTVEALRKLAQ